MSKKQTMELELITPLLAEKYLRTTPDYQRKIDEKQVRKIVTAIMKGTWRMNGATIVFNENGELIDGQHRLAAIQRCGKSVQSFVVRNVPPDVETFHTIGDEKPRRITDFIHTSHQNNVAHVISMYWHWTNGNWPPSSKGYKQTPPIVDVLKLGEPYVNDIVSLFTHEVQKGGRIVRAPSFCLFLLFFYTKIQPVKDIARLAEFFSRLYDGVSLARTDPAYVLRSKFLNLMPGTTMERSVIYALVLKSLHLYLDHEPCQKLQFRIETENYPELRMSDFWGKKKGDK